MQSSQEHSITTAPKIPSKLLLYAEKDPRFTVRNAYRYKYSSKIKINTKPEILHYLRTQCRDTKKVSSLFIYNIDIAPQILLYLVKHLKKLSHIYHKGIKYILYPKTSLPRKIYRNCRLKDLESIPIQDLNKRKWYSCLEKTIENLGILFSKAKDRDEHVIIPRFTGLKALRLRVREPYFQSKALLDWISKKSLQRFDVHLRIMNKEILAELVKILEGQRKLRSFTIKVSSEVWIDTEAWEDLLGKLINKEKFESLTFEGLNFSSGVIYKTLQDLHLMENLESLNIMVQLRQKDFEEFLKACSLLKKLRVLVFENYNTELMISPDTFSSFKEVVLLEKFFFQNRWKHLENGFDSLKGFLVDHPKLKELGFGLLEHYIVLGEEDWREFCRILSLGPQITRLELAFSDCKAPYVGSEYEPLLALAGTLGKLTRLEEFALDLHEVGGVESLEYILKVIAELPMLRSLNLRLPPIRNKKGENKTIEEMMRYMSTMRFLERLEVKVISSEPIDVEMIEGLLLRRLRRINYLEILDIPG